MTTDLRPTTRPSTGGELAAEQRGGVLSALFSGGARSGWIANLLLLAAAGTVAVSSAVHLHLWMTGYGHLPTIGPLFLFQAVVGFFISATLILTRRVWAAMLSFGFVCATIGGFLMAVYVGLYNFRDSWSAPFAGMAFGYEIASLALLVGGSTLCVVRRTRPRSLEPLTVSVNRRSQAA